MRDFIYVGWKPVSQTASKKIIDICKAHGIPVAAVRGQVRTRAAISARRAICIELRKLHMSYGEIGRMINRDHTSVIHHLKRAGVWQSSGGATGAAQ